MASQVFGDSLSSFHDIAYSSYSTDDVSKILAANQTLPVSVASLEVKGAGRRTRPSFLKAQVDPIINAPATLTLPELLHELENTANRFKRFGTYSSAEFKLDLATVTPLKALLAAQTDSSSSSSNSSVTSTTDDTINPLYESYSGIQPLDLKATLILTRKNPHPLNLKTYVRDNGPASVSASLALKNLLGGAETLSTSVSLETRPSAATYYDAEFTAPFCIKSPDTRVHLSAFNLDNSTAFPNLSYTTKSQGATLKLVSNSPANPASFVEFGLSAIKRGISLPESSDNSNSSPEFLLNLPTESLKTSVFSKFTIDQRTYSPTSPLYANGGHFVDWKTELAGVIGTEKIAGDVAFLKTEATAQLTKTLDPENDHVVFNVAAGTGLLWAYGRQGFPSSSPSTTLYDRFFLGGPNGGLTSSSSVPPGVYLHSYKPSSLGPKDSDGEPLGGDAYAAGTVSMLFKVPRIAKLNNTWATEFLGPLRILTYFSQASLVPISHTQSPFSSPSSSISSFSIIDDTEKSSNGQNNSSSSSSGGSGNGTYWDVFNVPATSAGLGLVYKTPAAQLELVYSAPFVVPESAKGVVRKGWQLGVGFDVDF